MRFPPFQSGNSGHGFPLKAVLIHLPVDLPVFLIGGIPLIPHLPGRVAAAFVDRVEHRPEPAVIRGIHRDHINQCDALLLAQGVHPCQTVSIFVAVAAGGQIVLNMVRIHDGSSRLRSAERGLVILLHEGAGELEIPDHALRAVEDQQEKNGPADQLKFQACHKCLDFPHTLS